MGSRCLAYFHFPPSAIALLKQPASSLTTLYNSLRKNPNFTSSLDNSFTHSKFEAQDVRNLSLKSVAPTVTIYVSGSLSKGHLTYLDQLVASAIDCGLWLC